MEGCCNGAKHRHLPRSVLDALGGICPCGTQVPAVTVPSASAWHEGSCCAAISPHPCPPHGCPCCCRPVPYPQNPTFGWPRGHCPTQAAPPPPHHSQSQGQGQLQGQAQLVGQGFSTLGTRGDHCRPALPLQPPRGCSVRCCCSVGKALGVKLRAVVLHQQV